MMYKRHEAKSLWSTYKKTLVSPRTASDLYMDRVIASNFMPTFEEMFTNSDVNADGTLTKQEFKKMLTGLGLPVFNISIYY